MPPAWMSKVLTQIFHRHRRALDVPPAPRPIAESQLGSFRYGLFHKAKSRAFLFVLVRVNAFAAATSYRKVDLRKLAIFWKRLMR